MRQTCIDCQTCLRSRGRGIDCPLQIKDAHRSKFRKRHFHDGLYLRDRAMHPLTRMSTEIREFRRLTNGSSCCYVILPKAFASTPVLALSLHGQYAFRWRFFLRPHSYFFYAILLEVHLKQAAAFDRFLRLADLRHGPPNIALWLHNIEIPFFFLLIDGRIEQGHWTEIRIWPQLFHGVMISLAKSSLVQISLASAGPYR